MKEIEIKVTRKTAIIILILLVLLMVTHHLYTWVYGVNSVPTPISRVLEISLVFNVILAGFVLYLGVLTIKRSN